MLVVAMPSDSEPGTPATDNPKTYEGSWNDERDDQSSGQPRYEDQEPEPASTQLSSDAEHTETPPSEELLGAPIMAMPAKVTAEDDDDYSGWMEEDPLGDEKAGFRPGRGRPAAFASSCGYICSPRLGRCTYMKDIS